jgi:fatty-acyl-CoA synthase
MNESSKLAHRFWELAQTQPEKLAIRFGIPGDTADFDFAKFWRRVERITGHLQMTHGLVLGQRVAWLGLNHELQLVTLVACARLGLIFMPLNFRLATAELHVVLEDAKPSMLIHDALHAEAAKSLSKNGLPSYSLESFIASPSPQNLLMPDLANDTDVLLVYTSGTTGRPKGAVHTQSGMLANAKASLEAHEFKSTDIVLSTLPLFHVGGLCIQTLPALLAGVSVHLHPRFDAAAWLSDVSMGEPEERPTLSLLVPATMRSVLEHSQWPSVDLRCLRGIMAGSSTLPESYLQKFHQRGVPVGQIYGTTETGPVSVILKFQDAVERIGFAGWPHANAELQLRDPQGCEVNSGETGEVCVRGANVMRGYWHASSQSAAPSLKDGWFQTGDMGHLDAQGCLQIVGRNKDMIISGGENIYPAEIENVLAAFPGLAECAVVGLPDERWGEVPVLVLVRAPSPDGLLLSETAIKAHLETLIARFKLPRRVVFVDELPKSALGKVQKPILQKQLMSLNS